MDDFSLFLDLHRRNYRQGPGGDAQTELAMALAGLARNQSLKLADIGCGTGASTLCLARHLNVEITAVDFLPDFLESLKQQAESEGLSGRIETLEASMDELPFSENAYDVLWSEGAIYNMGFQNGIENWKRFIKPGGIFVASEITWLTHERPQEIQAHWDQEYPEIDVASAKIGQLEAAGYSPIGYFKLPESCWLENYYAPLKAGFEAFLERNNHAVAAQEIVSAEVAEIELYEKFKTFYSYGVYIARKP